jgi:hypothetical protein
MKSTRNFLLPVVVLLLFSGCATTGGQKNVNGQEQLARSSQELREEQLLDVWIEIFDAGELPENKDKQSGLSTEIREAEARYIPVHLRNVMEKTGYWGAVRVVPRDTVGAELLVRGLILESDGEVLELQVTAIDASGRQWFKKDYRKTVAAESYNTESTGDSFEPLYHAIANDLAEYRQKLTDSERTNIRQLSSMRFAADMTPDAFTGHLSSDKKGRYTLLRLPAADDPAYQRVLTVRERDYLLVDTLNGHYDNFYREMMSPYLEWRKARSTEAAALREIKKKANTQKALGVAAILGAIAIEALGGSDTRVSTGTMRDVMVIGGLYSIKRGMDTNAQSTIHQGAIEELGESFSIETKPLVVEVDGEEHELTGSAETQYQQWRELMKRIYASETGLDPAIRQPGE